MLSSYVLQCTGLTTGRPNSVYTRPTCAPTCVHHTPHTPPPTFQGRTFNGTVLDRLELGMVGYGPAGTLGGEMPRTPAKPLMIFQGEAWDAQDELKRVRNLLQDFFRGRTMERGMALPSLQGAPVLVFTAAPQGASGEVPGAAASAAGWLLHMRTYSLQLRQSGMRVPKVELSPAGPFADLEVRRTAWAEPERWKAAVRVPKELKRKREKNISYTALGERTGRLHMEHQDLDSIQTRKMKGLKAGRDALVEAAAAAMAEGSESEHDSDSLPSDASALEFESDGASDDE